MSILDDGHTFYRALAFYSDAVDTLAAAGAAQFAQAVEVGHSRHGALLSFNRPTEKGEALQVDVSQCWTQTRSEILSALDIGGEGCSQRHKSETKEA